MKVQCDVCEREEASVFCCADEAALCAKCDQTVHDANKLASKHARLSLFSSQQDFPQCDICQEKRAFFFCRQDRALLCRDCDFSIHSANDLTAKHSRFLVLGTVSLHPSSDAPSSSSSVPDLSTNKAAARLVGKRTKTNPLTDLPVFSPKQTSDSEIVNPTGDILQYLNQMEEFLAASSADLFTMVDSSKGEAIGKAWAADIGLPMEAAAALYGDSLAEVPHTPSPSASMDSAICSYNHLGIVMKPKPRQHHNQPQPYFSATLNRMEDSFLVPDVRSITPNKRMRPFWDL